MKYVKASTFKIEFAKVIAATAAVGEPLVVVKNAKLSAALIRKVPKRGHSFFGIDKGKIKILGDIVSPIPELWEGWEDKLERVKRRRT